MQTFKTHNLMLDNLPRARTAAAEWQALRFPLAKQISSMQAGKHRWLKDPLCAGLYSDYLLLLRRTRERIDTLRKLDMRDAGPQAVAKQEKLVPDGYGPVTWAWFVPPKARDVFRLAFENLYSLSYHEAGRKTGKRLVPFDTCTERTLRQGRWDRLLVDLLIKHKDLCVEAPTDPATAAQARAVKLAVDSIRQRTGRDEPPKKWEHLLNQQQQETLRAALGQGGEE